MVETKKAKTRAGGNAKATARKTAGAKKQGSTRKKPTTASGTPRAGAGHGPKPGSRAGGRTQEERHRMIAEAAYFIAERRGFADGDPHEDWVLAEQQVDAELQLKPKQASRKKPAD
jgi:hypothetical protein